MFRESNQAVLLMLFTLLLLLVFSLVTFEFYGDNFPPIANKIIPLFVLVLPLWTAYRVTIADKLIVWSPLPWFFCVSALYYGFGPLLYNYSNQNTVEFVNSYYPITINQLFLTNILNIVSIIIVLIGFQLGIRIFPVKRYKKGVSYNPLVLKRLLILFLIIGFPIKYFLSIPYNLGLIKWVLPGSIKYFSVFTYLAIIVYFVLIKNGFIKFKIPLLFLILAELGTGLMTFSKMEVILVILSVMLGMYICKPKINRFVICGLCVSIIYILFLVPFVTYGRLVYNLNGVTGISQMVESIKGYAVNNLNRDHGELQDIKGWWARLNYANAQAFTMDAFEGGVSGNSFSLISYVVAPRVIYKEKPNMNPGIEFTEIVTGMSHSSTAAGVFGEAYWNGGWIYVIIACTYIGILFSVFTRLAIWQIGRKRLAYLPVIFMGIIIGLRIDDWFVPTYVGGILQIIMVYLLIKYFIEPMIVYNIKS